MESLSTSMRLPRVSDRSHDRIRNSARQPSLRRSSPPCSLAESRPPSPDQCAFPLLSEREDFIVGAHDLRSPQVTAVDDEPQFPSELVTPQLADRLPRMAADDLAEPPAFAKTHGVAGPILTLECCHS